MSKFKVGDKVKCVKGKWYEHIGHKNVGIIRHIYDKTMKTNNLCVEWKNMPMDEYGYEKGHDCKGYCKYPYGYYVDEDDCVFG